ncbi:LON peptidase substrate-binding domain-containing protein [Shewanella sp. NIFS-20-20]|uniref:LON peptidase substrate-binding domain-containing protein n=1 Tax=Shewanella sp. NIFS-20-20 TaxID=2853806 RepID=UPI001C4616E9|nr:LON peptidase substrate-binding domain-containing protein [Shewanella sp. NIFS-20-20]MBV7315287.1 ATP-dependent protease [Shewanella sp. NIFS-20-20]
MNVEVMSLFAIDTLILPQGRQEIRVVDNLNILTLTESLKLDIPLAFGMGCQHAPPCYPIVTHCRVIDFNQLSDNSLSIVIEGLQRVRVISSMQKLDKRWMLLTFPSQNWQHEPLVGEYRLLSQALREFYQVHPDLLELYGDTQWQDACWVSQRWLEVLPMYNHDKHQLLSQPDCHKTMNFMLNLIKSDLSADNNLNG